MSNGNDYNKITLNPSTRGVFVVGDKVTCKNYRWITGTVYGPNYQDMQFIWVDWGAGLGIRKELISNLSAVGLG